jgi:hypothetical protein
VFGLILARGSVMAGETYFFFAAQLPARLLDPPSLLSNGYRDTLLGVRRTGREADHSSPSGAKFKSRKAIPSLPHPSPWSGE